MTNTRPISNESLDEIRKNATKYNSYVPMTEKEMLAKPENSRNHAGQEKYRDADDVISDMRAKYGL